MELEAPTTRIGLNDWQAVVLRVTVFGSPAFIPNKEWWKVVTGQEPDKQVVMPKSGEQIDQGLVLEGQHLVVHIQPTRTDWLLSAADNPATDEVIQVLGPLQDALDPFEKMMSPWLASLPHVQRIAFGTVLLYPVDDREKGYKLLSGHLPFKLDPETSSDFSYQINRARTCKVGEYPPMRINRLSKWSVLRTTVTRLVANVKGTIITRGPSAHACRLELDINTDQEFADEFRPEQLVSIWHELWRLGLEIAQEGDTP